MFSLLRSVQREGGQTLNKGPAPIGAAIIENSVPTVHLQEKLIFYLYLYINPLSVVL